MSTQAHLQELLALETRTIRVVIPVTKLAHRPSNKRSGCFLISAVLAVMLLAAFLALAASQTLFGLFIEQMQQVHRGGRAQVAYSEIGEMSH